MTQQYNIIGNYLVNHGLIQQNQLDGLQSPDDLRELLLDQKIMTQQQIQKIESLFSAMPTYTLDDTVVDPEVQSYIPYPISKENRLVCVKNQDGQMCVVTDAQYVDPELLGPYAQSHKVTTMRASSADVDALLSAYENNTYSQLISSLDSLAHKVRKIDDYGSNVMEKFFPEDHMLEIAEDIHVAKLLKRIVAFGFVMNASEVIVQTQSEKILLKMRVGTEIIEMKSFELAIAQSIYTSLRYHCDMPLMQQSIIEKGYTQRLVDGPSSAIPVQFVSTATGYTATLHIGRNSCRDNAISELNLSDADTREIEKFIAQQKGICVISGKEKSGKSFAYYQLLESCATDVRVTSLEKEIEYIVDKTDQLLWGARLEKDILQSTETCDVLGVKPCGISHLAAYVSLGMTKQIILETAGGVMSLVKEAKRLQIPTVDLARALRWNLFSHRFDGLGETKQTYTLTDTDLETIRQYVSDAELLDILRTAECVPEKLSTVKDIVFYNGAHKGTQWKFWKLTRPVDNTDHVQNIYVRSLVDMSHHLEKAFSTKKSFMELENMIKHNQKASLFKKSIVFAAQGTIDISDVIALLRA